jgi:hypothetical protein
VDPVKPTYDALVAVFMGTPINTAKISLLADLKGKRDGKAILQRLVKWADVVLVNQVRQCLVYIRCLFSSCTFLFVSRVRLAAPCEVGRRRFGEPDKATLFVPASRLFASRFFVLS